MRYLTILLFVFNFFNAVSQQKSSFNNQIVNIDSSGDYHFIVSGHFYGDGTNKSRYPVNTLLGNLDWINNSKSCMLISLGDLFMDVKNDIPQYKTSLFDKLNIPLFNAVGNHDLTEDIYQKNFGATYFYFLIGRDVHWIIDTEMDDGDNKGDQLKMFKEIEALVDNGQVENLFIYGHRTIWKETYSQMDGLFEDNTQSIMSTNFESEILPNLKTIAKKTKVYFFAGSLGDAPSSFFYFEDNTSSITYIATAIRGLLRDAVLVVHVKDGVVSFETKSLTNQPIESLESYGIDFWKSTSSDEPFNYRLIPYYLKLIFFHRIFWYGMGFAFILIFGFKFLYRKFKRN